MASSSFSCRNTVSRRAHGEDLAFFEDDELLAKRSEVVHAVGHHDYGQPHFFVQRGNEREEISARGGVEPGRWLVEDEHLGLHGEYAREGHAALLAARKLEGAMSPSFEVKVDSRKRPRTRTSISCSERPMLRGPNATSS